MIWCSLAYNGVGSLQFIDGSMKSKDYLKILKRHLIQNGKRLIRENFFFQQDNSRVHKAEIIGEWLSQKGVNIIDHTPQESRYESNRKLFYHHGEESQKKRN